MMQLSMTPSYRRVRDFRGALAETAQMAVSPTTRNTLLILGFGLSAALLLFVLYPGQHR